MASNFVDGELFTFKKSWRINERDNKRTDYHKYNFKSGSPILDDSANSTLFQDTFSCNIDAFGAVIIFRSAMQSEFWTFTIFCDFSSVTNPTAVADESLRSVYSQINNIHQLIVDRYNDEVPWKNYGADLFGNHVKNSDDVDKFDNVYNNVVNAYIQFCERLVSEGIGSLLTPSKTLPRDIGTLFGNFVGLIFGLRGEIEIVNNQKPLMAGHNPRRPLKQIAPSPSRQAIPKLVTLAAKMGPADALHLVDAAWPLIKKIHLGEADKYKKIQEELGKPEFTVSLFQRGRALYASALGRQATQKYMNDPDPVIFTLFSVHANRWQLGRLIDRIHELGSLRLSAVRDFEKIFQCGQELSNIRTLLASDTCSISQIKVDLDAIETKIPGGLEHRLERSRYYIERFETVLKSVSIDRVEGFQQYDEFVKRRLGDKFSTIEYVSRLYGLVNSAYRSRLNLNMQTVMVEQVRGANDLLIAAERVSIVPLTYYLGTMLHYSLEGQKFKFVKWYFDLDKIPVISIYIACLAIVYWLVSIFGFSEKAKRRFSEISDVQIIVDK